MVERGQLVEDEQETDRDLSCLLIHLQEVSICSHCGGIQQYVVAVASTVANVTRLAKEDEIQSATCGLPDIQNFPCSGIILFFSLYFAGPSGALCLRLGLPVVPYLTSGLLPPRHRPFFFFHLYTSTVVIPPPSPEFFSFLVCFGFDILAHSMAASALLKSRVRRPSYLNKLAKAEDLIDLFPHGSYIGWSGFTGVGYPK